MRDNAGQIRALIEGWAGAVHEGRIDTVVTDHAEDLVMVHSGGRGDGDHGYPRATAACACGVVVVELGRMSVSSPCLLAKHEKSRQVVSMVPGGSAERGLGA